MMYKYFITAKQKNKIEKSNLGADVRKKLNKIIEFTKESILDSIGKGLHKEKKSSYRRKQEGQEVRFKSVTARIFKERLRFKNGMLLRNFDIETESLKDSRKVRRIVEKRMCQAYHKLYKKTRAKNTSNNNRYWEQRATSFQLHNIGQIENVINVSRGKSTHWKKMFDIQTGKIVFKKKMPYNTKKEALGAIQEWKSNHPSDKKEMHAYNCGICHKWHIGHESNMNERQAI